MSPVCFVTQVLSTLTASIGKMGEGLPRACRVCASSSQGPRDGTFPNTLALLHGQGEDGVANGKATPAGCREGGITEQTYYCWRKESREEVRLAALPADGPSDKFFNEDGPLPW